MAHSLNEMSQKLSASITDLKCANEKLQADIERERALEQAQLDFFSAVSHELKTPITVIKGQTEGMILNVGDYQDRNKYLVRSLEIINTMENMVQENLVLAIGIYTILTIISCVVLALPGVTFAIVAGLVFGPVLGTICCSVATTLGAMVAFVVGRFFLQDIIKPMAMKNKYLKKWLFDESGNNEVFILMITRLVPLFPYNLQNFAYGVTDIKFSTYSICSLIFMLPGTAMYTVGMAGLADKENRILYIGIAIVLAGIVIGLGAFLKKHYVQEEKNEG